MMELYLYIAYEVRFKTLQKVLDKRLRLRILSKWQDSFLKRHHYGKTKQILGTILGSKFVPPYAYYIYGVK